MGAIIASLHLPSSMVQTALRVIAVVADHSSLLSSPLSKNHHLMDHIGLDEDRKAEMKGHSLSPLFLLSAGGPSLPPCRQLRTLRASPYCFVDHEVDDDL